MIKEEKYLSTHIELIIEVHVIIQAVAKSFHGSKENGYGINVLRQAHNNCLSSVIQYFTDSYINFIV